jgi:hypothetical protein
MHWLIIKTHWKWVLPQNTQGERGPDLAKRQADSCPGILPFMSVLRLVYQTDYAFTSPSYKTDSAICDMILADVFHGLLKATRKTSDVTVVLRGARSIVVAAQDLSVQSAQGELLSGDS